MTVFPTETEHHPEQERSSNKTLFISSLHAWATQSQPDQPDQSEGPRDNLKQHDMRTLRPSTTRRLLRLARQQSLRVSPPNQAPVTVIARHPRPTSTPSFTTSPPNSTLARPKTLPASGPILRVPYPLSPPGSTPPPPWRCTPGRALSRAETCCPAAAPRSSGAPRTACPCPSRRRQGRGKGWHSDVTKRLDIRKRGNMRSSIRNAWYCCTRMEPTRDEPANKALIRKTHKPEHAHIAMFPYVLASGVTTAGIAKKRWASKF